MLNRLFSRNFARSIAMFLTLALTLSSLTVFAQDDKKKRDKERERKGQEEKLKSVYKRWVLSRVQTKLHTSKKTNWPKKPRWKPPAMICAKG